MKKFMIKPLLLLLAMNAGMLLIGCGDATTTVNEKEPIAGEDDHDDHDHDGGTPGGTAVGRLLIINTEDTEAEVYNLSDSSLLATIALDALPSAVYATGGYRYAALIERSADTVGFIDGGLWQEPHDDHFDLFMTTPTLSNFSLTGSRPTHFVPHDGQVAVFYDGNADVGENAAVQVFDDHMIEDGEIPLTLELPMAMHGVAEPRGDHLLVSVRRDDSETTSTNFVLPDQVGVYHLHDGEYELEQTLDVACPDLHGTAQNETHIVFGCSDGVLLVSDNGDDTYSAQKLVNSDDVAEGLRIGSIWGHHESEQFIGQASAHGGDAVQYFTIDPAEAEMELIDWQPVENAKPVAQDFAFEAEMFVILDDQGYLTVIDPHVEGDHTHWEYGERLDITDADVAMMPEGMNFAISFAENGHTAFVADPIEQHVRIIDLDLLQVSEDIELVFSPAMVTWLGVAAEHEH